MKIQNIVIESIHKRLGNNSNESGGILGGSNEVITRFEFDRECSENEYIPDNVRLNKVIKEWSDELIKFIGLIHSHQENRKLSYADVEYARSIIKLNGIQYIHMFLFIIKTNEMVDYIVYEDEIIKDELTII